MAKSVVGTLIMGAVAVILGASFLPTIVTSVSDANLTGFALIIWGLIGGILGLVIVIALLKEVGIKV